MKLIQRKEMSNENTMPNYLILETIKSGGFVTSAELLGNILIL